LWITILIICIINEKIKEKMKKSKLRNIIRETIKEIHGSSATQEMHIYQGCNFGAGGSTGIGNTWGIPPYDGFALNQSVGGGHPYQQNLVDQTTAGSVDAMLIHNSNIIHNLWNSPQPGEVVRVSTCDPAASICQQTCLKYIGPATSLTAANYVPGTYGMNSNLSQIDASSPFPSCAVCGGGLNPNTVPGCNDLQAYVMQTWAPQQPIQNMPLPVEHFCEWCVENQPTTHQHAPSYQDPMCICCDSWVTVPSVYGCVDPVAINYDPNATIDDGSCQYSTGCNPPIECWRCHQTWGVFGDPNYDSSQVDQNTGQCMYHCVYGTTGINLAPAYTDPNNPALAGCQPTPTPPPSSTPEDPQAKMDYTPDSETPIDKGLERMQKLANIDIKNK
jgi:hypothetical protein